MPIVNIDGRDYDFDSLPQEAKDNFASLQYVNAEFQRVNSQIAVLMTARAAYLRAVDDGARKSSEGPATSWKSD